MYPVSQAFQSIFFLLLLFESALVVNFSVAFLELKWLFKKEIGFEDRLADEVFYLTTTALLIDFILLMSAEWFSSTMGSFVIGYGSLFSTAVIAYFLLFKERLPYHDAIGASLVLGAISNPIWLVVMGGIYSWITIGFFVSIVFLGLFLGSSASVKMNEEDRYYSRRLGILMLVPLAVMVLLALLL